ncbi:hypothetical protein GCM10010230_28480 [Streptomyces narbonensis]|uniref:hypothetical protein n=1 Tax=Streptomyces narbonensis TaxID=67333 RepID=UPI001671D452|nr:hypothetical protein [Streptomyces narbonensis]GGW00425.1 hypothetical protein GCM10010230_28480 [Streptomyces narbonensis]
MHALLRRPVAVAFLCATFTLSATACDRHVGDLTKSELLDKAIRATESAESVTVHSDGFSLALPVKSRTSYDGRGNCTTALSYGTSDTIDVIRVDGDTYVRRGEARLRREEGHRSPEDLAALIDRLGGRWTKPPVDGPDAPAEPALCGRLTLDALENGWGDDAAKGEPTTVDGRKALKLVKAGTENETAVHIAAEGPPYILRIVTKGGDTPGTTTFDYDRPVEVKAPPAGAVVMAD